MQARELLLNLLKIRSPSKKEKEIARFIVKEIGDAEMDEIGNVIVYGKKGIFVATHMDTIDRNYSIKEENKKIYGIGACDAKASIVSLILFLKKIKKPNFSIVFLCDEEEDATGSKAFLRNNEPEMAIIMEPTSLKLCNYHAGNLEANFKVYGEEMHGSFCNKNTIENFIRVYEEIKKLKHWKKGKYFDSCITLQEIECKNPYYLNPKECKGRLEARLLAEQNANEIANDIKKIVKNYGEIEFKEIWNGFEIDEKEEIVEMCKKAMQKSKIDFLMDGMPSWTDALLFNEKGIKCVVFGPGNLKIAHTEKENIDIEEIEKACKFLISFNEVLNDYHHNF